MKQFKISRRFTYKAYVVEVENEALITADCHVGEFVTRSDCHYYCEKAILDAFQSNDKNALIGKIYLIYKVSTVEDSTVQDMLLERIQVVDGQIVIQ